MNYHGEVVACIIELLSSEGPMTVSTMAAVSRKPRNSIRKACARMSSEPRGIRRIHVASWTYEVEGARDYPRQVYKLGDGENRKRPKPMPRNKVVMNYMRRCQQVAGVNAFGPIHSQKISRKIAAQMRKEKQQ